MINKNLATILIITCLAFLASCNSVKSNNSEEQGEAGLISEKSTKELIQVLERAGDGDDPAFNLFGKVIEELEKRGQSASEAAPTLAEALAYKRRDSGIASHALIAMGQSSKIAIPELLQNLEDERGDVRRYSAFILGIIGKPAECSIPKLSELLWDTDSAVRSTTAAAIDSITSVDLVWSDYDLDPTAPGVTPLDEPEGSISGDARIWWQDTGQKLEWTTDNCVSGK
jgi:hypothetical protein